MENADYILCECDLEALELFVMEVERQAVVQIVRQPSIATTMIRAEDSVEGQPFYLGEALITECELTVDGQAGFGVCLGDEPVRSYCIAVVDALIILCDTRMPAVKSFLAEQEASIGRRLAFEHAQIQRTKVDFKLMEED
jgi:alpha-D-ribose 1-methylphosphonate 5-triphosphate synthase subunit PhnG